MHLTSGTEQPDAKMKSSPNVYKQFQKIASAVYTLKMGF